MVGIYNIKVHTICFRLNFSIHQLNIKCVFRVPPASVFEENLGSLIRVHDLIDCSLSRSQIIKECIVLFSTIKASAVMQQRGCFCLESLNFLLYTCMQRSFSCINNIKVKLQGENHFKPICILDNIETAESECFLCSSCTFIGK